MATTIKMRLFQQAITCVPDKLTWVHGSWEFDTANIPSRPARQFIKNDLPWRAAPKTEIKLHELFPCGRNMSRATRWNNNSWWINFRSIHGLMSYRVTNDLVPIFRSVLDRDPLATHSETNVNNRYAQTLNNARGMKIPGPEIELGGRMQINPSPKMVS